MNHFKDHFSTQSEMYAKFRPQYPVELFQFLSSLTPKHDLVWDCGTGNGQAAIGLVPFYQNVIATDPSDQQILNSFLHERIQYRVVSAENFEYPPHTFDLITIANALHWFDLNRFYPRVHQLLNAGGVIAAWSYAVPKITPEIDICVSYFHDQIVGEFWVYENKLVELEYSTLHFPFTRIPCPSFFSQREMNMHEFLIYLNTWSATQKYIARYGHNPTDHIEEHLQAIWGNVDRKRTLTWKLHVKVGRPG